MSFWPTCKIDRSSYTQEGPDLYDAGSPVEAVEDGRAAKAFAPMPKPVEGRKIRSAVATEEPSLFIGFPIIEIKGFVRGAYHKKMVLVVNAPACWVLGAPQA